MTYMLYADFASRQSAEQALDQLEEVGYRQHELQFITRGSEPEELALLNVVTPAKSITKPLLTGILLGGLFGVVVVAVLVQSSITAITTVTLVSGLALGSVLGALIAIFNQNDRTVDDNQHFAEVIAEGGAVIGVPVNSIDEDTVRTILRDCQHGMLDSGWYGENSKEYFSHTSGSAARTPSSSKDGSDSRIRASRLP